MEKFTVLQGIAAPMLRDNIDTDAIIAAQAMVGGMLTDPGRKLFTAWRYRADGSENPDFVLNRPRYRGARIIVAGRNFGCGSSREHAVWALAGYGIGCVIAPSFGEIFYDNACQNGLLPAIVPVADVERIAAVLEAAGDPSLTVDLEALRVILPDGGSVAIAVPAERREALLQGLDELSFLLSRSAETERWTRQDRQARPWIRTPREAA
jgi:3-isopropylmalate/(R)-2-methylmalate dehydratase small subunit